MKKNILKKVISMVLVLCFMAMPVLSFATGTSQDDFEDIINNGNSGGLGDLILSVGGGFVGIIRIVGNLVALGMLIWLGVKWMMSSAQEKADLKNKAWGYVLGAVLVFGASTILPYIAQFAETIGQ